eukprot:g9240.t1
MGAVGGAVAGSLDTLKKRLHPGTAKTAGPLQVTGAAPGGGPFVVGPGAGRVATSSTAGRGSAAATTPVIEAAIAENGTALAPPEAMNGGADDDCPGGAPLPPLCRPQSYRFMREVLPPDATQEAVYASAAAGLVEKFTKENFNGLLFTYGQTGTGKTHTIFGPAHSWHDMRHVDAGVFPRAVVAIFESYEEQSRKMNTGGPATRKKFLLTASAMEFYMCQCTDLLDKNQACLIDEADHLPIGLSTVELTSPEDALAFMDSVRKNRVARETLMNKADKSGHAGSSRSHCALILTVREQVLDAEQAENTTGAGREDGENNNEILTTACYKKHLHIVDMAGAERPSSTGTENEIAIQAIMAYWRGAEITVGGQGFIVNYELSGLRTAVVQASEQHRKGKKLVIPKGLGTSFIEYTSGCFTGSNLLAMIVTLSPAPSCGWETWFSCSYGADLRKLRCPVKPVQPCCWARAPGRRKTLTGAGGGGEGTSTEGVLEKFVKELQKKASAAQAELEQTTARGGAGAKKYLLKRTINARHCAREAALWGRLLQK